MNNGKKDHVCMTQALSMVWDGSQQRIPHMGWTGYMQIKYIAIKLI